MSTNSNAPTRGEEEEEEEEEGAATPEQPPAPPPSATSNFSPTSGSFAGLGLSGSDMHNPSNSSPNTMSRLNSEFVSTGATPNDSLSSQPQTAAPFNSPAGAPVSPRITAAPSSDSPAAIMTPMSPQMIAVPCNSPAAAPMSPPINAVPFNSPAAGSITPRHLAAPVSSPDSAAAAAARSLQLPAAIVDAASPSSLSSSSTPSPPVPVALTARKLDVAAADAAGEKKEGADTPSSSFAVTASASVSSSAAAAASQRRQDLPEKQMKPSVVDFPMGVNPKEKSVSPRGRSSSEGGVAAASAAASTEKKVASDSSTTTATATTMKPAKTVNIAGTAVNSTVSAAQSSPLASSSSLKVPYNLIRKVCPAIELPHCHPHHLEISNLFPGLRLDDDFWHTVVAELKSHDFPAPDTGITFSDADLRQWEEENACPIGFEQAEWEVLKKNFNPALPNGVFDSLGFKNLLASIGAPCTVAMATHLLMRLRCLESGRVRCETACYAMRAVQRVIARRSVADDLAMQVHVRREATQQSSAAPRNNNRNSANNSDGYLTPLETPRSTRSGGVGAGGGRQQQQQQRLPSESGGGTTSNPITPRGTGGNNNNSNNNHKNCGVSPSSGAVDSIPPLHLMMHPGVHRPVVTPVSPPHESGQHHHHYTGSGSGRSGATTPRGGSAVAVTATSNSNLPVGPNSLAVSQHHGGGASESQLTPRSVAASSSRGMPNLGARRSPPRDDRRLITEEISGIMCNSPHRSTLKQFSQHRQREQKRLDEEAAVRKAEEMEGARREKYGMRPASTKRSASSNTSGSVARSGSRSPMMMMANSFSQNQHRAPSMAGGTMNSGGGSSSNNNHLSPRSVSSHRSPSAVTAATALTSNTNNNNNNSNAAFSPRSASQIQTSLPTGESHAVLMRARQNRADGADKFLSVKARNAVLSEPPKVEHGAVYSPDKQTILWNSQKATPVVTVSRTAQKNVAAPPQLGVYYPGGSPRSPRRPSVSPDSRDASSSRRRDPSPVRGELSPTQFSRRPRNWR